MKIDNEKDLIKVVNKTRKKAEKRIKTTEPKISRLLKLFKIIQSNLAKGEHINLTEWYYPAFI